MIGRLTVNGSPAEGWRVALDDEPIERLITGLTISIEAGGTSRAILEYFCRATDIDGDLEIIHVCPHSPLGDVTGPASIDRD